MTKRVLAHLTDSDLLETRDKLLQEEPETDIGREIKWIQIGGIEMEINYRKQRGSWSKGEAEQA